jgi:hypothetical protein
MKVIEYGSNLMMLMDLKYMELMVVIEVIEVGLVLKE